MPNYRINYPFYRPMSIFDFSAYNELKFDYLRNSQRNQANCAGLSYGEPELGLPASVLLRCSFESAPQAFNTSPSMGLANKPLSLTQCLAKADRPKADAGNDKQASNLFKRISKLSCRTQIKSCQIPKNRTFTNWQICPLAGIGAPRSECPLSVHSASR